MKRAIKNRIGLSLLFSLIVLIIFIITSIIILSISFFVIRAGFDQHLRGYGLFAFVLILMLSSIMVGTIVTLIFGRVPLKPLRKVITAINQLARGDFTTRLNVSHPPELKELADSFNCMAQELGGIEMLRTDFVNNFSHEFKTPIVSIKGFAEMLKHENLPATEKNDFLDVIISESERLASLATNILNLSKVENQTILTDTSNYNLSEQIRRCIVILEKNGKTKILAFL